MKYVALVEELADAKARLEVLEAENADLRESVYPLRHEVDELNTAKALLLGDLEKMPGLLRERDGLMQEQREHVRLIEELRAEVTILDVHREALYARLESDRRDRWLRLRDRTFALMASQAGDHVWQTAYPAPTPVEAMNKRASVAANIAYGSLGQPEQVGVQRIGPLIQRENAAE